MVVLNITSESNSHLTLGIENVNEDQMTASLKKVVGYFSPAQNRVNTPTSRESFCVDLF